MLEVFCTSRISNPVKFGVHFKACIQTRKKCCSRTERKLNVCDPAASHRQPRPQLNYEPEAYCAVRHIYSYHRTRVARIQPKPYHHKFVNRSYNYIAQRLLSSNLHLDIGLSDYAPSVISTTLGSIISILFAGTWVIS